MNNRDYKNSWQNKVVFEKQLQLNKKELSNYPTHWVDFIDITKYILKQNTVNMLDIGCGCGTYYKLCKDNFDNVNYTGLDYSQEAVDIAKTEWKTNNFICKNMFDLDSEFLKPYNTIHMGAVLDILSDGDHGLDFILNFKMPFVIIGRIEFSNQTSNVSTYTAYDEIITYKFKHGIDTFNKLITKNNYNLKMIKNSTILLEKNNND